MRTHIKAIKYIILAIALLLVTILLVYTQPQKDLVPLLQKQYGNVSETLDDGVESENKVMANSLKGTTVEDIKQTVMQKPNYLGEDINKKLWSLKAVKAIQTGEVVDGFTDLYDVVANTLSLKDSKVEYIADKGKFLSSGNKIILTGNVLIKSEKLELKTQTLEYQLDSAYAESTTQVDIKAEMGNIVANSMKSYNNGDRLVLNGDVRAKFYNIKKD